MAVHIENVEELCSNLEELELDGSANAEVYTQLLAIYLLQCDICNAKFLWKRIPEDVKASCPELSKLWTLGCHMWKRDYLNIYSSLQQDWSPLIQTYMVSLKEKLQEKAFNLIANAYTYIKVDDFVVYMGMTKESAIEVAKSRGWIFDTNNMLLNPKKPDTVAKEIPLTSEQELGLLTDYVSFLEN
ncbi:COP9 signalosome complex subunit 8-like [Actinia tenebrosa]|uniref:COP9 signalosome complex subunit 8-like n=1 Tax=Actinia tenebrosa TaxID=6105 RepID=A0A6P8IY16_ACTTE|nr:COP9 signalosome complex subunit 8-like [Actinia tenebrosa]